MICWSIDQFSVIKSTTERFFGENIMEDFVPFPILVLKVNLYILLMIYFSPFDNLLWE